ncbi:MAG TPA: 30S ribosomal protein S6 [Candidatus Paceibacterota bacterium]
METGEKGVIYEVSYLLLPYISQEQIESKVATLKEAVQKISGELISDENPVLIDLAYPMTKVVGTASHKCDSGYFGWLKFEAEAGKLSDLKKSLDNNSDILRYLIIKTVRENTLLNGKMKFKSEERVQRYEDEVSVDVPEAPEVVKESTPEEIDKSIDELVVV